MSNTLAERYTEIQPVFARIAARHDGHTEHIADVLGRLALGLVEQAAAKPEFIHQQDGYLAVWASWRARQAAQGVRRYERYVDTETLDSISPEVNGEEACAVTIGECIAADGPSVEEIALAHVEYAEVLERIEALGRNERQVGRLLANGYQPGEIARKLGLAPATVSRVIARIRAALVAQGLTR